jgi:large subunit ribosomal protein L18
MKKVTDNRQRRANRIRKKIQGTAERPRLCVRRSLSHMYAQIVDDISGRSIAQAGSTHKEIIAKVSENKKISKTDVAKLVGELIADKAKEKGVEKVVFDRKGYAYHGRIKALAEAARKKGLQF